MVHRIKGLRTINPAVVSWRDARFLEGGQDKGAKLPLVALNWCGLILSRMVRAWSSHSWKTRIPGSRLGSMRWAEDETQWLLMGLLWEGHQNCCLPQVIPHVANCWKWGGLDQQDTEPSPARPKQRCHLSLLPCWPSGAATLCSTSSGLIMHSSGRWMSCVRNSQSVVSGGRWDDKDWKNVFTFSSRVSRHPSLCALARLWRGDLALLSPIVDCMCCHQFLGFISCRPLTYLW